MSLSPGFRLGSYTVETLIGAGGMGEVYRARDTRLDRTVAIKTLPDVLAIDPDRRARFDREAKILASLHHPQIAGVYGFEETQGSQYLILEFVDGESLAQRITRGPVPIDEAIHIAGGIADGLAAAHERGIIHRDLKPANVMLTRDGEVKLLDFGLARSIEAATVGDSANSPTLTSMGTRAGLIVGTAAYLAPEQVKGRPADRRTDVWAFGCVLYEMLAARRAFGAADATDTLAAILRDQPDWSALPPNLPHRIRGLAQQCLERDATKRIADVEVVRYLLHNRDQQPAHLPAAAGRNWAPVWSALALLAVVASVALAWSLRSGSEVAHTVSRFAIPLPDRWGAQPRPSNRLSLSEDGTKIVYTLDRRLYLRPIDQLDAVPIQGVDDVAVEPVFSPDAQWVGYFSWQGTGLDGDCVLYKVPTGGGTPIALATVASVPYGAVWRGNDILVAVNTARFAGIQAVPAKGGSPRTLISVDPQKEFVAQPDLLDDGDQLVYVVRPARLTGSQGAQIVIQSLSSGGRSVLANGTSPHVVSAGALVFRDGAALLAAPFNARTRVIGAPVQMIDGVSTANLTLSTLFAVSRTGTLVFVPSNLAARTLFVSVDRQGRETPIAAEPRAYRFPRISPDGTTIAVDAADQEHDIWVLNLRQESLRRFTFGPDTETGPLWDADGRAIIYSSVDKVFRKPLDGTRPAELIGTLLPGLRLTSVSPDGRWLFWRSANVAADAMFAFPLDHSGPSKQLLPQADYLQWDGEISPDGHWIAYASNESGTFEVYVRPFPDVDAGHWRVSTDGAQTPMWSRSGKELFFMATTARSPLMGVAVHTEKFFEFEKPRKLFDMDPYLRPGYQRAFDVFPDDQRFLLLKSSEDAGSQVPRMVVVTNWFDELRARMQPGR